MKGFFDDSDSLDYRVLRPLAHIRPAWELTWDLEAGAYREEPDSFAAVLNGLVKELAVISPPARYHDSEDRLAEFVRDGQLKWPIRKVGQRWVGADYDVVLQQGSFDDIDQGELLLAAAGRIQAACDRAQTNFDAMEGSHQHMLAAVLSIILWQRAHW
jgi:hypothetical protein